MTHLTPERIGALLEGTLPPDEARSLAAHLAEPCPACEALLADGPDLDTLARLLAAEDAPAAEPGAAARTAGWAGIEARLPAPAPAHGTPDASQRTPPARRRRWWAFVAAAAVAAGAVIALRPPAPGTFTEKGTLPPPPAIRLKVVEAETKGDQVRPLRRLSDGDAVTPDAVLLFETEVDRVAARYLWVVEGDGRATRLLPTPDEAPSVEPAGARRAGQDGGWTVIDVSDMTPPLTLVAGASVLPLDPDADVLGPWREGRGGGLAAYDTLTVDVSR